MRFYKNLDVSVNLFQEAPFLNNNLIMVFYGLRFVLTPACLLQPSPHLVEAVTYFCESESFIVTKLTASQKYKAQE